MRAKASNADGGVLTLRCAAADAAGSEGGAKNRMRRWGAHGGTLVLHLAHDSPTWPGRSGCRRRAATHAAIEA